MTSDMPRTEAALAKVVAWAEAHPDLSWKEGVKNALDTLTEEMATLERELAAANARADKNEKDAGRYRWILKQAQITDFIFRVLNSKERHVSNAIDAAIAAKEKQ